MNLDSARTKRATLGRWAAFTVAALTFGNVAACSDKSVVLETSAGGDATGSSSGQEGGCLIATVEREPGDTQQPWVKWPLQADGIGTLIVSASQGATVKARKTVPNADMKPVDASYAVDLGCSGAGTYVLRAFLDDDGDAAATDITSNDHVDSCMGGAVPEQIEVTVQAGETAGATLSLYQTCNPLVD